MRERSETNGERRCRVHGTESELIEIKNAGFLLVLLAGQPCSGPDHSGWGTE